MPFNIYRKENKKKKKTRNCNLYAYIRMKDTKTKFFVLGRRIEHRCKLVLCFSLSFTGMAMGYIGDFKQGYSFSGIIVSLFQTVFSEEACFLWLYKQDELRFTIISEYYWWKYRRFSTRPNVSCFASQATASFFFQPVRTWRPVFSKRPYTLSVSPSF